MDDNQSLSGIELLYHKELLSYVDGESMWVMIFTSLLIVSFNIDWNLHSEKHSRNTKSKKGVGVFMDVNTGKF